MGQCSLKITPRPPIPRYDMAPVMPKPKRVPYGTRTSYPDATPSPPLGTQLNRPPPPLTSGDPPNVYQKPFHLSGWYPLLNNGSSIITSPLIRGMSEWDGREGPAALGREPIPFW